MVSTISQFPGPSVEPSLANSKESIPQGRAGLISRSCWSSLLLIFSLHNPPWDSLAARPQESPNSGFVLYLDCRALCPCAATKDCCPEGGEARIRKQLLPSSPLSSPLFQSKQCLAPGMVKETKAAGPCPIFEGGKNRTIKRAELFCAHHSLGTGLEAWAS